MSKLNVTFTNNTAIALLKKFVSLSVFVLLLIIYPSLCFASQCNTKDCTSSVSAVVFQAEDYVNAYDTTPGNTGGAHRSGDVDIQATSDAGGGFNVAWVEAGEWLASDKVNIPAGNYKLRARVASPNNGGSLSVDLNSGSIVLGQLSVPNTEGWQNWTTTEPTTVQIANSGDYSLGIYAKTGGWNINWIELTPDDVTEPPTDGQEIKAMSLNVYGHATMPQHADDYAALIRTRDPDVVGIQEGVNDWQIGPGMPTDYSRADALGDALGDCWEQRHQIFINTCKGNSFVSNRRFDLTDGPNATRTGESAVINKNGFQYAAITVHWDHESGTAKIANAHETAAEVNSHPVMPVVVVGDFNAGCTGGEVNTMIGEAGMRLIGNAGIDCIVTRGFSGSSQTFDASPSDHPSLDATLNP